MWNSEDLFLSIFYTGSNRHCSLPNVSTLSQLTVIF